MERRLTTDSCTVHEREYFDEDDDFVYYHCKNCYATNSKSKPK